MIDKSDELDAIVNSAGDMMCQIELPAVMSIANERIQTPEDLLLHLPSRIMNHRKALSVRSLISVPWPKLPLSYWLPVQVLYKLSI